MPSKELEDILEKLTKIAESKGLKLSNVQERVAATKQWLFGAKDFIKCPCSPDDIQRFCVSERCLEDIRKNGQCYCKLFKE